jgi:hypothetical protein
VINLAVNVPLLILLPALSATMDMFSRVLNAYPVVSYKNILVMGNALIALPIVINAKITQLALHVLPNTF